jgi:hypothetical protein
VPDILEFLNNRICPEFPQFSGFMPTDRNMAVSGTVAGKRIAVTKEEVHVYGLSPTLIGVVRKRIKNALDE